ncbi:MAG: helicase HerA-like domain-containing protein [Flammeovirgaceae bacterium]
MEKREKFIEEINQGYTFKGDFFVMGGAMLDGETIPDTLIKVPLKTLNRHGLIAGATGTGKTKTLQSIAERLSENGVPVLLMDIKGDLSGIAAEGKHHPKIDERHEKIGIPYSPMAYPVELLSLSNEKGAKLRATVSEFGPVLLSKILSLNDTQSGVISLVFKYCDDTGLPLLDLKDLRKVLQYVTAEGKAEVQKEYGSISSASVGAILRKIIELEQQGADQFFGERSFDVEDLMRTNEEGMGYTSIIRLTDMQSKPKLFSTFMLCLLAELYETLPEQGDADKPKLVVFIDEAHLVFDKASDALLEQLEQIIKLIRSKGVGLFFCTQNPADIPADILGQLGMKVQHALRAFTARDRKAIKLAAENYPITEYYDTATLLTSMGIGEAAISVLNEKGIPTPLAATLLTAPRSRMDILSDAEMETLVNYSDILKKYNEDIDRESAYEILNEKLNELAAEEEKAKQAQQEAKASRSSRGRAAKEESFLESMLKSPLAKQVGRTVAREVTRGLLGALGIKSSRRRRTKSSSWF